MVLPKKEERKKGKRKTYKKKKQKSKEEKLLGPIPLFRVKFRLSVFRVRPGIANLV